MTSVPRSSPSSILMVISGDGAPLRMLCLGAWLLGLAFAAGCVVAVMGVCASLEAISDRVSAATGRMRLAMRQVSAVRQWS